MYLLALYASQTQHRRWQTNKLLSWWISHRSIRKKKDFLGNSNCAALFKNFAECHQEIAKHWWELKQFYTITFVEQSPHHLLDIREDCWLTKSRDIYYQR